MKTFRQFLLEARQLNENSDTTEKLIEYIKKKCSIKSDKDMLERVEVDKRGNLCIWVSSNSETPLTKDNIKKYIEVDTKLFKLIQDTQIPVKKVKEYMGSPISLPRGDGKIGVYNKTTNKWDSVNAKEAEDIVKNGNELKVSGNIVCFKISLSEVPALLKQAGISKVGDSIKEAESFTNDFNNIIPLLNNIIEMIEGNSILNNDFKYVMSDFSKINVKIHKSLKNICKGILNKLEDDYIFSQEKGIIETYISKIKDIMKSL